MTTEAIFTLIVLIVTTILFFFNVFPLGLVSMTAAVVLAIGGVITPADAFAPLANTTSVLIMSMIVIGYALFHNGVAGKLAKMVVRITGKSENGIMIATVASAMILSSICSGVAVVAVLLPVVIGICKEAQVSISRQLIPLSFAASVGCSLTLVGAASNVVVDGIFKENGLEFIGFFELGKVGIVLCILFLLYFLTIGKKLLRKGDTSDPEYIEKFTESTQEYKPVQGTITVVVLIAVIIAMALDLDFAPMFFVSAIGVIVLIFTGCLNEKEFFKSIDHSTLFIVGGLTALASAVSVSGLGKSIADAAVGMLGENPNKVAFIAMVLISTCLVTNLMSNTGTAALVTPIFIPIAQSLNINVVATGVAICIAATLPFLTPYGSGTNTLLIAPGRLTVRDFFVPGVGFTVICIIASIIVIPIAFPL